ncbi:MAG: hypothetical protein DCC67_17800 [Planctomycetota bacterium]|nr:MAG: hypothetical protein DCC67_17800 [Planctomycetota bacterium]
MKASLDRSWCASSMTSASARLVLLLMLAWMTLTGCGGCRPATPAERAAREQKEREVRARQEAERRAEEKKNQPFHFGQLTPLLSENLVAAESGQPLSFVKPGHWTATVQPMRSNLADFEGRLTIAAVDDRRTPLVLPHTPYRMVSSRPVVLAKGQTKRIESEMLVPGDAQKLQVLSELAGASTRRLEQTSLHAWSKTPSHQYFMLVLAREPTRYSFLKVTDAVSWPYEDDDGKGPPHYRVVLADGNRPLPLPASVLTWTSVAYVVWDEVNLQRVSPAQQTALVDWMHWGGRLIINGPDSLDDLRGSFLGEYLPVDPGERIEVTAEMTADFSLHWSQRQYGKTHAAIALAKPWSGIALKPREGARPLPAAEGLFYERRVGLGSIVASAVQLTERELVNWPGFDGFLHGGLLRRPARQFSAEQDGAWGLQTAWAGAPQRTRDAYFTTPVRWFARDAFTQAGARQQAVEPPGPSDPYGWSPAPIARTLSVVDRPGGLGDWSEFGPVSKAARAALAKAAGVRVPAATFVVACLAVYLFVLAPLNWMVFHALGRVEWAWISAPIIAVLGAVAVVRLAQLDIGFVRSQTEIALLELQGDYPRGHLSRYTAIYSSLSSSYDLEFEGDSAVATPFPVLDADDPRRAASDLAPSTVAFERYDKTRLRGVQVASASTQMIHSEQMAALAGPVRLFAAENTPNLLQLQNKSGHDLADAVVVHRRVGSDGKDVLRGCWLGRVRQNTSALLSWSPLAMPKAGLPYAAERAQAAKLDYRPRLDVDPLLQLALRFTGADDPLHGLQEEYRLVARIDEVLPGAVASPAASQQAGATVVLAHLRRGDAAFPELDLNSPSDVADDRSRNAYDEELDDVPSP